MDKMATRWVCLAMTAQVEIHHIFNQTTEETRHFIETLERFDGPSFMVYVVQRDRRAYS